jgi:DNA-binding transcriptional MerR regulator
MKISTLAERTGVPVPTIKYYLREGLLQPGLTRGATRADYDESHIDRIRLIRTLVTTGALSIERVRLVVTALDHPPATRHELLATAHAVLRPATDGVQPSLARDLVDLLGWPVSPDSSATLQLADAVATARAGGWSCPDAMLVGWGSLARTIAEVDVSEELGAMPPSEALQHAIVGTVLTDPILIALRRVAQEAVSAERLGSPGLQRH